MKSNKLLAYGLIIIILGCIFYLYKIKDKPPEDSTSNRENIAEKSYPQDSYNEGEKQYNDESIDVGEENYDHKDDKIKKGYKVKEYWSGEWKGIDKWKRRIDVIRLVKQGGAYVVLEDHTEPRIYNFDSEKNVFIWKGDFYGKELKHIVKFFNSNTLLRNSWSGKKDFPELYQRIEQD